MGHFGRMVQPPDLSGCFHLDGGWRVPVCAIYRYFLKGTVARDFRPLVFFINQSHLGH
jgi:hypothetical protein